MTTQRKVLGVTFLSSLLVLVGCADGSGDDMDEAPLDVHFLMSSQPFGVGQSTYTTLPEALGFWEEEGLEVRIDVVDGSAAAWQAIDAGQADISIGQSAPLVQAVAEGGDVKGFYSVVTEPYQYLATTPESDISSIEELEGATIGVYDLASGSIPLANSFLQGAGVDLDSVDYVAVGYGAEALAAIQAGRIDAFALWDDRYAEIENLGQELVPLRSPLEDDLSYQIIAASNQQFIDENPEAARGFVRGIARAAAWAVEHPEEAVQLHWEEAPDSRPTGIPEDEALEQAVRTFEARMQHSMPVDGLWGYSPNDGVANFINLLAENDELPDGATVEVDDVWTDEFIEYANDFDEGDLPD